MIKGGISVSGGLIVETRKGVRVSEDKRAKKVRWVPTTTTLVNVFAWWRICLCFYVQ